MAIIYRIIRGVVYSHVYLSVAASFFYFVGYRLIGGHQPKIAYLLMVFLSTFITYNIYRFLAKPQGDCSTLPEKEAWHQQHHRLVSVLLIAYVFGLGLIFLFYLDAKSILFLSHLAAIAFFYNLPDTYLPNWLRIRRIPLMKVVLVGYVWGALSILLPALRLGHSLVEKDIIMMFLAHLSVIIAITIPFDFRDMETDRQNNLVTLPLLIRIKPSKAIAIVFVLIFVALMWSHLPQIELILFSCLTSGFIIGANTKRHELYFSLGLDGIIFIYSLSVIWMMGR